MIIYYLASRDLGTPESHVQTNSGKNTVIKDHLKKWCTAIVGKKMFDSRFQAMPFHPGLRHWKHGISIVKQWNGTDHKQLQRVFVPALVGTPNANVIRASRALLDFVYLAQYHSHTDETLQALQDAFNDFHALKDVFIELGCRKHFNNIPKLHSLVHYVKSIRLFSSLDGFNTENSERLHIEYAKKAYAATNRKDYTIQMTKWLNRQEAVIWFNSYLRWCDSSHATGGSDDENSDDTDDTAHEADQALPPLPYRIARRPHFPGRTAQFLVQHHGAVAFVEALQKFLTNQPPQCADSTPPA
ncbi:hypothetical protein L210DRAFT_962188 [Boletus edulis BED1]|uniref:Uncharacterized protein n=1 Tax=Boletus edulis BED1 TaxID=1328754 RepID=A0AAD4BIQ7_BOLED|nr:hypothetical protein L210DRAFT_962188 [Boletus edulis BED1]